MTNRSIEFIKESGEKPWFLHLSYIKPHWPYIAPAPYHNMYSANQFYPVHRSDTEKNINHPVYKAFMENKISKTFSREEVRNTVLSGYMGLIKQIDDNLGRLFKYLEEQNYMKNTMIVFTSDHGDYQGDHWLGEKELFHEQIVKVPMIIYDPCNLSDNNRELEKKDLWKQLIYFPLF